MTSTPKKTIVLQSDDSDSKGKTPSVPGSIDTTKACENCFTLGSTWYQGKHAHLCDRCKDSSYFAPLILKAVRSRYFDRLGIDERKYNESQLRTLFPIGELLSVSAPGQLIHRSPIDIKNKQTLTKGGKKSPVIYTFRSGDVDKWIELKVLEETEKRRRQEEEDRLRQQLHQQRQQQQQRRF